MASGAGIAGAVGGFGRGLANVLLKNRDDERRRAEREEDVKARNFSVMFPVLLDQFSKNPTPEAAASVEKFVTDYDKNLAGLIKKSGFTFEQLGPMLSSAEMPSTRNPQIGDPSQVDSSNPQIGDPSQARPVNQPTEVPGVMTTVAMQNQGATVPKPGPTMLFGMPVQTPEEQAERALKVQDAAAQAQIESRVRIARRMGMAPAAALDYAFYGTRPPAGSAGQTTEYEDFLAAWAADKGKDPAKLTSADRIAARKEWTAAGSSAQGGRDTEFGQYYTDWLKDKGKTEEQGTSADRLAARKEFMGAGQRQSMTPGQEAAFTRGLRQDRVRETAAASNAIRQVQNMKLALADVNAGRRLAGDQAIISTFNRIIEPDSVTMVSEYARTPQGLATVDRFKEAFNRVFYGGSGVDPKGLAELVSLAEAMGQNQVAYANDVSAEIEAIAKEYGIKPELVGREFALPGTTPPPTRPTTPAAGGAPNAAPTAVRDANGNWVLP